MTAGRFGFPPPGPYVPHEPRLAGPSGAPPKFMRWDGDGHLAVQLHLFVAPLLLLFFRSSVIRIDGICELLGLMQVFDRNAQTTS